MDNHHAEHLVDEVATIACNTHKLVHALEGLHVTKELYAILEVVTKIREAIEVLTQKEIKMSAAVDALVAEVSLLKAGVDSSLGLLDQLFALYSAAGTDPAAIAAVTADLQAKRAEIEAALARDAVAAPVA